MFPSQRRFLRRLSQQRGNLYIVVIFVLVVIGFLAAGLSKVQWSNSDAQARSVLGTQAWLLAHSANEWALTQLYPLRQNGASFDLASACSALTTAPPALQTDNCRSISVSCRAPDSSVPSALRFYRVESSVQCGSGIHLVERRQQVWVREVE